MKIISCYVTYFQINEWFDGLGRYIYILLEEDVRAFVYILFMTGGTNFNRLQLTDDRFATWNLK